MKALRIIGIIVGVLSILLALLFMVIGEAWLFIFFAAFGIFLVILCRNIGKDAESKKPGTGLIILGCALLLVGLFIAFGSHGSSGSSKPTKVSSGDINAGSSAGTASEETYGPGDTVELEGVRITFHGLNETMGNELWHPDTNKVYAIAEFTVDNGTDKQIDISSIFGSEAYCDGYLVHEDFGAELGDRQGRENLTGSIAPGRKMRGIIGYQLPQQWQELEIRIQSDWWKGRSSAIIFVAVAN